MKNLKDMTRKHEEAEVAVIVLTVNQRNKTRRCLESLREAEYPKMKILVWDNGSSDGTCTMLGKDFPEILTHFSSENIGVASGRNAAAKMALERFQAPYLLFLDNDMTVSPDFLRPLVKRCEGDKRIAQATPKIRFIDDHQRIYGAGGCKIQFWLGKTNHKGYGEIDRGQYDQGIPCISSGGCMLIKAGIFKLMSGFDPVFDPYGPEDLDLGLRIGKAGFYGIYVPESTVFHDPRPGKTFENSQYTKKYAFFRSRHWFLFMKKHASTTQTLAFLMVGAPYLLTLLVIREYRKGNLGHAIQGLFQGFYHHLKTTCSK